MDIAGQEIINSTDTHHPYPVAAILFVLHVDGHSTRRVDGMQHRLRRRIWKPVPSSNALNSSNVT